MGSYLSPPATALAPGDRLDRYELLCVLAQGGMGTVWLGRMTGKLGFERLVALKTILPEYTNDRQFCAMFLDEAGIAARVDHENVARILDIGEDRGFLYYAMELIDGESLRKVYRDVRTQGAIFPIGAALRVCADACAGLHAVHELRGPDGRYLEVVHRDVSPQNILVTVRGTTKLIDFGVAKARERRSEETSAGTLKGKLEYMAPEQAAGEPVDRRADVYALGAILYELLAGRPVRETADGRQIVALHELVTGAPYPPLPSNVPHLVRSVVDRAIARDPDARYRTADELRHALEQVILATGQGATIDDVSGMLARYSRERTTKRKEAIELAVRYASEGRIIQEQSRQEMTIVAPIERRQGGVRTGPNLPAYEAAGSGSFPVVTAGMPFAPNVPMALPSDGPPTGPSIRTMEGASMSARPAGYFAPPPKAPPAGVVIAAFILGLVALLGVVAGVVITKRGLPFGDATVAAPEASVGAERPADKSSEGAPAAGAPDPGSVPVTASSEAPSATAAVSEPPPVPPAAPVIIDTSSPPASVKPPPKPPTVAPRPPPKPRPKKNDEYGF